MTNISVLHGSNGPSPFSWQSTEGWWGFRHPQSGLLALRDVVANSCRDGDDGAWSTFFVRVGDTQQTARVLPSTAGQATWVVMTEGCKPDALDCNDARGGLVNLDQSRARKDLGIYKLGLEKNLGHNASGDYGLDTLSLGLRSSPTLDSQVVVGIQTNRYRVGIIGLNQQPTNLSNFTHPYPSLLTTLRTQDMIPSLS